jgi:hypothetical protein
VDLALARDAAEVRSKEWQRQDLIHCCRGQAALHEPVAIGRFVPLAGRDAVQEGRDEGFLGVFAAEERWRVPLAAMHNAVFEVRRPDPNATCSLSVHLANVDPVRGIELGPRTDLCTV